jgi:hypothetical protein
MTTKKLFMMLGIFALTAIPCFSVLAQIDTPEELEGLTLTEEEVVFGVAEEEETMNEPEEEDLEEENLFEEAKRGTAPELFKEDEEKGRVEVVDESDIVAPTVLEAKAESITSVVITFSEEVLLPTTLVEDEFAINEELNRMSLLEVVAAEEVSDEPTKVRLITARQTKGMSYTLTVSANITDLAGNPIVSGITDTATFTGTDKKIAKEIISAEEEEVLVVPPDTTPPEEITNFLISFEARIDKFLIQLSWIPSINSAGDLIDQILYTSLDRGKIYDQGKSLGPTAASQDLQNMEGGKEYTFKITTKDVHGNESTGVIKSIRLPQTGPLAVMGIGVSLLIAGGVNYWRKKK